MTRLARPLALAALLAAVVAGPAHGHAERWVDSPPRPGDVPSVARIKTQKPVLDVCKSFVRGRPECRFRHIQAAVNAAPDGALIRIWPGLYREQPSRRAEERPPDNPDGTFSYEFHEKHPNAENLIAVVGKKDITLLGMGRKPRDVVIDVAFKKHVGIRGDRADGMIVKNLSVFHAFDHGVYLLDLDGFVIDRVVSGWSRDYAFLTFAVDHGLYRRCVAFGAGDAGIYPGGTADTPGRHSVEIDRCVSRHNVLGYSGTQGDHVWVHDSVFRDNAIGLTSDSETDHPNYPQNNLVLERNRFHDNDFNPHTKESDVYPVVFADFAAIPPGIGMWVFSGNDNVIRNNHVWGNDEYGILLTGVQGVVLGPTTEDPPAPPFFSSGNRVVGNRLHPPAGVEGEGNGVDLAYDGLGFNNCWEDNVSSADGDPPSTDPVLLPPCSSPLPGQPMPTSPPAPNALLLARLAGVVKVDTDADGRNDTPVCALTDTCFFEYEGGPDPENARNLPEGYRVEWREPPTCGPRTCPWRR